MGGILMYVNLFQLCATDKTLEFDRDFRIKHYAGDVMWVSFWNKAAHFIFVFPAALKWHNILIYCCFCASQNSCHTQLQSAALAYQLNLLLVPCSTEWEFVLGVKQKESEGWGWGESSAPGEEKGKKGSSVYAGKLHWANKVWFRHLFGVII